MPVIFPGRVLVFRAENYIVLNRRRQARRARLSLSLTEGACRTRTGNPLRLFRRAPPPPAGPTSQPEEALGGGCKRRRLGRACLPKQAGGRPQAVPATTFPPGLGEGEGPAPTSQSGAVLLVLSTPAHHQDAKTRQNDQLKKKATTRTHTSPLHRARRASFPLLHFAFSPQFCTSGRLSSRPVLHVAARLIRAAVDFKCGSIVRGSRRRSAANHRFLLPAEHMRAGRGGQS